MLKLVCESRANPAAAAAFCVEAASSRASMRLAFISVKRSANLRESFARRLCFVAAIFRLLWPIAELASTNRSDDGFTVTALMRLSFSSWTRWPSFQYGTIHQHPVAYDRPSLNLAFFKFSFCSCPHPQREGLSRSDGGLSILEEPAGLVWRNVDHLTVFKAQPNAVSGHSYTSSQPLRVMRSVAAPTSRQLLIGASRGVARPPTDALHLPLDEDSADLGFPPYFLVRSAPQLQQNLC
jgi:hypothetical protein